MARDGDVRCYGCGEPIEQDDNGAWFAVDRVGWFYMCAAMNHQDNHAPSGAAMQQGRN